jgi:hypothetical protein
MNKKTSILALSVVMAGLAACGGSKQKVTVNGIEMYQKYWDRAVSELRPRASLEMQCDGAGLEFNLLKKFHYEATEIVVKGCDKSALYIRPTMRMGMTAALGNWQLSSVQNGAGGTQGGATPPPAGTGTL